MNRYDPNIHHRRSIRLYGYDYSQAGLYFITIVCKNRKPLFGKIVDPVGAKNFSPDHRIGAKDFSPQQSSWQHQNPEMILNNAGKVADQCWLDIPNHFPNVQLHEYIVMPNHVHGIIEIVGDNNNSHGSAVGAKNLSPSSTANANNHLTNEHPLIPDSNTNNHSIDKHSSNDNRAKDFSPLQSPLRHTPSRTVGSIVRGYKIGVTKWMRQNADIYDVWQRNYWEHIIRDEKSYLTIADYIINNPAKWSEDKFYTEV